MLRSGCLISSLAIVCLNRCGVIRVPVMAVSFLYMASTWSEFMWVQRYPGTMTFQITASAGIGVCKGGGLRTNSSAWLSMQRVHSAGPATIIYLAFHYSILRSLSTVRINLIFVSEILRHLKSATWGIGSEVIHIKLY